MSAAARGGWLVSLALLGGFALWLAAAPLGPDVEVDFEGDWRHVCEGFRRRGHGLDLVGAPRALVHFHGLDGRPAKATLEVSDVPEGGDARLEVRRGGVAVAESELDVSPSIVAVDVPSGATELDLELEASESGATSRWPFALHGVTLERKANLASRARQAFPLLSGLAALAIGWRRVGPVLATAWAALAAAGAAGALLVALDPAGLMEWRPGVRARAHVIGVVALAATTLLSVRRSQQAAFLGVAALAIALQLPTLRGGLVYDDFLWARQWSVAEVASTFAGSEDPLGVSNTNYRPLASLTHALDFLAWGFRPAGYHATNLLLFGAAAALALRLLLVLGAPAAAAAVGALVLAAHPLAASSAAWISERTDTLALGFGLLALTALVSPQGERPLAVLPFVLAAVWSKELGVMLPALGALLVWVARPSGGLRARGRTLAASALLVVAYVLVWLSLFPEKALARVERPLDFSGFDARRPGHWWGLLPALYGPLLWPTDWQTWRRTPFADPSLQALLATLAGPALLLWLSRRPEGRGLPLRLVAAGLAWAPLALLPALGLRGIDLYRLGLVPAFGAALVAAGLACYVARGESRLLAPLAAGLVLWMAPHARSTADAWGPGGFHYEAVLGFNRAMPDWLAALPGPSREEFERQWRERQHREQAEALDVP